MFVFYTFRSAGSGALQRRPGAKNSKKGERKIRIGGKVRNGRTETRREGKSRTDNGNDN